MADKRIHELATTTDKSGKFLALDEAGLSEALKFSADSLIDKAFTDTLYVKLAGDETVNGVKTWNNNGIFEAGILVNLGGIDVTGNSNIAGTLGVDGALTVTAGGIIVTGVSSIAGKLTISTGGFEVTGNSIIHGTLLQDGGTYSITLSSETIIFSRNSTNYIHAATVGGNLVFITNGQAKDPANANLVLSTTQESYFNNNLGVGVSDPVTRLHIQSDISTNIRILTTANFDCNIQFFSNTTTQRGTIGWDESAGVLKYVYGSFSSIGISIDTSNHVGIGTDTPGNALLSISRAAANGQLLIERTGSLPGKTWLYSNDNNFFIAPDSAGSPGTPVLTIETDTGLATFTGVCKTTHRFNVDSITSSEAMHLNTNQSQTVMRFSNGGAVKGYFGWTGTGDSGLAFFNSGGSVTAIMDIDGNFGIGDPTPDYKVDITQIGNTTGLQVKSSSSTGAGGIILLSNTSSGAAATTYSSGKIDFYKADPSGQGAHIVSRLQNLSQDAAGSAFNFVIETGQDLETPAGDNSTYHFGYTGQLTITAATAAVISLESDPNIDAYVRFRESSITRGLVGWDDSNSEIQVANGTGFSANSAVRIGTGNKLGSGVAPTYQLDVQTVGTTEAWIARFYNVYKNKIGKGVIIRTAEDTPSGSPPAVTLQAEDGNGTQVGFLGYDTGSGFRVVDVLSSKHFKKNIKASKIKGIEKLKAVRPKNYKWKGRTPEEEAVVKERGQDQEEIEGYLIEDLEIAMPDVVSELTGENGETIKGYSATGIIKYLHKGILELTERLEALETP